MKPANPNTALLLFTRSPREEARHKNLLGKGKTKYQSKIFRYLIQQAKALSSQANLPLIVITSDQQIKASFGEKLHHAIISVFSLGFEKVIVIGNDCPTLKYAEVKKTTDLLQTHAAVFGPARDGGVYLLGLDKALFLNQTGFDQINWQTSTVLSELQNWSRTYHSCTLSKVYSDLDSFQGLRAAYFVKDLPEVILLWLKEVLKPVIIYFRYLSMLHTSNANCCLHYRGPPTLV